jgi:hypothetical protein
MARTILTRRDLQRSSGTRGFVPAGEPDKYWDRLLKYIPGETISLYVTLGGLLASRADISNKVNGALFLVCLIGTPVYLALGPKVTKAGQLFISTLAFGIWALATGGMLHKWLGGFNPAWTPENLHFCGSIALFIFTFFVPLIAPNAALPQDIQASSAASASPTQASGNQPPSR